jgi:hypothetical protein
MEDNEVSTLNGLVPILEAKVRKLEEENRVQRKQIIYQNAEIQRFIERYEARSIPPGLRFNTNVGPDPFTLE